MQHVTNSPPLSFAADRFIGKSIETIAAEHGTTPATVAHLLADMAHMILADLRAHGFHSSTDATPCNGLHDLAGRH